MKKSNSSSTGAERERSHFSRSQAFPCRSLFGLVFLFAWAWADPAGATHFRGGTIDYTIASSGLLTVEMTTLWRDGYVGDAFVDLWSGNRSAVVKPFSLFAVVSDVVVNPAGRDLIGYYARRTSVF